MAGGRRSGRAVFWDWATVFAPKGPSWGRCLYLALGPWAARLEVTAAQLDKRLPKAPKGLSGAAWWEERIAACERLLRELGLPEPWVELCARRVRTVALCPALWTVAGGDAAPALALACYQGCENYLIGDALPEALGLLLRLHLGQFFAGGLVSGQAGEESGAPGFLRRAWEAAGRPVSCWLAGGSPAQREEAKSLGWRTVKKTGDKGSADLAVERWAQLAQYL